MSRHTLCEKVFELIKGYREEDMKTRILFPVMLVVLLCIPTLGSATIIPIGEPILGHSWTQVWVHWRQQWVIRWLDPGNRPTSNAHLRGSSCQ